MKNLVLLLLFLFSFTLLSGDNDTLYGPTDPRSYLTGKFDPAKHPYFVRCSELGIPTDGRRHYLRRDTAEAFKRLYNAFKKDHPNVPLYVKSATRSFWHQRSIWNAKFTGERRVEGKRLNRSIPDVRRRTLKILEYSSMPGTSRHHWGTDLDINRLVNSYYTSGEGKVIFSWFQENASRYGFYQVYTAGREGGYNTEMWHWSYLPVSEQLLQEWVDYFKDDTSFFSGNKAFGGSNYADELALIYVTDINPACKK